MRRHSSMRLWPRLLLFVFVAEGLVGCHVPLTLPGAVAFCAPRRVQSTVQRGATDPIGAETAHSECHDDQIQLPNGQRIQVLTCMPTTRTMRRQRRRPVLLFLHGSFHGAWCWRPHFLPHFAQLGYVSVAMSWRGTSASPVKEGIKKIAIQTHVQDLHELLALLPSHLQTYAPNGTDASAATSFLPPVLISHSFGGLVVMKYLEDFFASSTKREPPWSGVVSLCSVPPSGNGPMTLRYLQTSLLASWRITRGLAMKHCVWDVSLCRTLFFDETVPDATLQRYQESLMADSKVTIDLMDLARQLPSKQTDPVTGQALSMTASTFPRLVVGATKDYIVDGVGVQETARYYLGNESHPKWVESPHDVMLGAHWKRTADEIEQWLVTVQLATDS